MVCGRAAFRRTGQQSEGARSLRRHATRALSRAGASEDPKAPALDDYWTPSDVEPTAVYHDVLIAYDEQRGLNNGPPSLWAFVFDKLSVVPGEPIHWAITPRSWRTGRTVGRFRRSRLIKSWPSVARGDRLARAFAQDRGAEVDSHRRPSRRRLLLVASRGMVSLAAGSKPFETKGKLRFAAAPRQPLHENAIGERVGCPLR
jgi:hypothetical protein